MMLYLIEEPLMKEKYSKFIASDDASLQVIQGEEKGARCRMRGWNLLFMCIMGVDL